MINETVGKQTFGTFLIFTAQKSLEIFLDNLNYKQPITAVAAGKVCTCVAVGVARLRGNVLM